MSYRSGTTSLEVYTPSTCVETCNDEYQRHDCNHSISAVIYNADIVQEAAKGADLWSIFDLMGFVPEEAYAVYKEAAEHDTPFSFPVTLKDKSEPFNMTFRCSHVACDAMSC